MDILEVLVLQLLAVPVFTQIVPSYDIWGDYGAYGPCSRTCGIGISVRTRKCVTQRTDGGHNCVGSSKSYLSCNSQECPLGSRDFREDQCSEFDRLAFKGKRYSWVPYRGASNQCELHCVPRGNNLLFRQRAQVVDGTPCQVGRTGICVDGSCRPLIHGEYLGLDQDVQPPGSPVRAPTMTPGPRDAQTYAYTTGVYGACSATCDGGMQYRSVECVLKDPLNPRAVDMTFCIARGLQAPASQIACNMHPCAAAAEYRVSIFSACSVTCGEGQQTRKVLCTSMSGERLGHRACSSLQRPPAFQSCSRPRCPAGITWHISDYGLCTRSCGGGVRDRLVVCYDTDLNPHPEDRCGLTGRPVAVESCNPQPCPGSQMVRSAQGPGANENPLRGLVPYIPGDQSATRPHEGLSYDRNLLGVDPHCEKSRYGCCADGTTSAKDRHNTGCPESDCVRTRYGCCMDGITSAQGFGRSGCPDHQTSGQQVTPTSPSSSRDICFLPRAEGPCDVWTVRFYYDSASGKCTDFWYGSCQGNANNFASREACQRLCRNTSIRETTNSGTTNRRAKIARARA